MRGILFPCKHRNLVGRIIPAGAGHFSSACHFPFSSWDYPRRCGAFRLATLTTPEDLGLSPQVRGISSLVRAFTVQAGIIPAGAGHLRTLRRVTLKSGDYPRRCGAFRPISLDGEPVVGLSPQVRGISALTQHFSPPMGIIPAGAGHLLRNTKPRVRPWDYPRRCGAFQTLCRPRRAPAGLSPQVRGIF